MASVGEGYSDGISWYAPSLILYSAGFRSMRCMRVRTFSPIPELKYVQTIFSIFATLGSLSHDEPQGLLRRREC